MPDQIVVDLDDFQDAHALWALPLLDGLYHESAGRFKATLFVIPARTSDDVLRAAAARPYLELAVHGWTHDGPECATWTAERTREVLAACLAAGCEHEEDDALYRPVFKAPHWVASPAVYAALRDAGWTVADHPKNVLTIPQGLRRYVLSLDHRIGTPHRVLPVIQAHGHFTQEGVQNGLRENLAVFRSLSQWNLPYAFVSEVAC